MKHAFWDRLLIILCTLLLLLIAAFGLGLVFGWIPMAVLTDGIADVLSDQRVRILFVACAVSVIVLAVFHFWIVMPKRRNRAASFALQQTEHGTLKISVKALEHLVQKCLAQHPELTPVYSSIHSDEEAVRVDLRVTLQSDINIPLAIAALQKQIKQYIEACSGVDVDEVRVFVEGTTPAQPNVMSPYRIPEMLQPHLPKLPEATAPVAVLEPTVASLAEPADEAAWMEAPSQPAVAEDQRAFAGEPFAAEPFAEQPFDAEGFENKPEQPQDTADEEEMASETKPAPEGE